MRKILFNDKYGLTEAVLQGRKTMTRRIITRKILDNSLIAMEAILKAPYKVGDVVAVAMAYKGFYGDFNEPLRSELINSAGFFNKMFVKASLMPHTIRITDVKVERLQDISDEECLKEGISDTSIQSVDRYYRYTYPHSKSAYHTPREAFASLIDKVGKKGTWEKNPYVYAYTFELVK